MWPADCSLEAPEVLNVKNLQLSFPDFGFIVATRAALGAGIGLLAGARLRRRERRLVGLALMAVGAVTTIPAILAVRRGMDRSVADPDPRTVAGGI